MDELKQYVDDLFKNYKNKIAMNDLKDEIYSNMIAKYNDLISQGENKENALKKTRESISSIDDLIEGNQLTYYNRFHSECLQDAMIYLIAGLILSIPLIVLGNPRFMFLIFIILIIAGIKYLNIRNNDNSVLQFINSNSYKKINNSVWLIWSLFVVVTAVIKTGAQFASNIWFSRTITFDGPYTFATFIAGYYGILLTIIVPMYTSHILKLLYKHNAKESI